jgi:hypothetical protein
LLWAKKKFLRLVERVGSNIMLRKMEKQPHMIVNDIREANPDNWFRYGVTTDNTIHLAYLADTQDELLTVSAEDMKNEGFIRWGDVNPKKLDSRIPAEMGGLDVTTWSV